MDTNELGQGIAELLIVLSITSGLMAIALPHFTTPSLKPEVQALSVKIQSLAVRSIQSEEPITIAHIGDKLQATTSPGGWQTHLKLPKGCSVTQTPDPLVFYPQGVCSPGQLQLSKQSRICHITVSLRCRVRVTCN